MVLRGEEILSDPIDAFWVPAGWSYYFYGPKTAEVELSDGRIFSIMEKIGKDAGPWSFYGPEGESITVLFLPKGVAPPAIPPTE